MNILYIYNILIFNKLKTKYDFYVERYLCSSSRGNKKKIS